MREGGGRRFADDEFATSTWDLRKYLYMPRLGLKGVMRISPMRDVSILSGAGVGGGSLGYANTFYRAPKRFFEDPQWGELADWQAEFAPHYDTAERMLGVAPVTYDDPGDDLLKQVAARPRRARTPTPRSTPVCSSASPARPCRTRTSAARGRSAGAA